MAHGNPAAGKRSRWHNICLPPLLCPQKRITDLNAMIHSPEHFLSADNAAGKVMAHVRLLQKLDRRFGATAPSGLRHAARVANYKSGTVVIHAENGAVAAKLRQLAPRLALELAKCGAECHTVDVRVQPRQALREISSSTQKPLSDTSFRTLQATADSLPEGPLRQALSHLLARAARR